MKCLRRSRCCNTSETVQSLNARVDSFHLPSVLNDAVGGLDTFSAALRVYISLRAIAVWKIKQDLDSLCLSLEDIEWMVAHRFTYRKITHDVTSTPDIRHKTYIEGVFNWDYVHINTRLLKHTLNEHDDEICD